MIFLSSCEYRFSPTSSIFFANELVVSVSLFVIPLKTERINGCDVKYLLGEVGVVKSASGNDLCEKVVTNNGEVATKPFTTNLPHDTADNLMNGANITTVPNLDCKLQPSALAGRQTKQVAKYRRNASTRNSEQLQGDIEDKSFQFHLMAKEQP